jgi:hypothetical protein
MWMSRPVSAGPFHFAVASSSEEVTQMVDAMFHDLPSPTGDQEIAAFLLTPTPPPSAAQWDLSGPNVAAASGMTLPDALATLMTKVNLSALDAEPERLHVHAGAVVRDGRAIVMSAPRDTGKTTTVTRLVLRGWGVISDEAISIAPGDPDVRGWAKPLSIKALGRERVSELAPHMVPPVGDLLPHDIVHVPLGAAGARLVESARPQLILLLRRQEDSEPGRPPASLPVHPADATVHLMTETMDAGRFGAGAVLELARLAARCACHELLIGDHELTADHIEDLAEAAEVAPLPVQELEDGAGVAANVVSLLVGDRAVIHVQPEGQILALDAMASQIWLNLGGWPASQVVDLEEPYVASFVQQLAGLGLVA